MTSQGHSSPQPQPPTGPLESWIVVEPILAASGIDSLEERKRLVRHGAVRFATDDEALLMIPERAARAWLRELIEQSEPDSARANALLSAERELGGAA